MAVEAGKKVVGGTQRARIFRAIAETGLGRVERAMVLLRELEVYCQANVSELTTVYPLCLVRQALLHLHWGQFAEALAKAEQAVGLARQVDGEPNLADLLTTLGAIQSQLGLTTAATATFREQLEIFERTNRIEAIAHVKETLGRLALAQGKFALAEELLEAAQTNANERSDRAGIAAVLDGLAELAFIRCNLDKAELHWAESAAIHRELESREGLASAHDGLIRIAYAQENWSGIAELKDEIQSVYEQIGARYRDEADPSHRANVLTDGLLKALSNLAWADYSRGDTFGALAWANEEESVARAGHRRFGLGSAIFNQAVLQRALGRIEEGLTLGERCEAAYEQLGSEWGVSVTRSERALGLEALGKLEEAAHLLEEHAARSAREGRIHAEISALTHLARIYAAQDQTHQAHESAQSARKLAEGRWPQRIRLLDEFLGQLD